jgi:Protein of unknown function (DUF4236)
MGFYFRKSARFGPFRVNFSTSGVGVSVGVPGFRIGTGPRGNYVHAGAHGFYYRAALPSARARSAQVLRNREPRPLPQPESHVVVSDRTLGTFRAIESANIENMADSSSEALLEEIRLKHRRISWWQGSAVLGTTFAVITWSNTAPEWVTLVVLALAALATLLTFRWDLQRKLTILHYELNPAVTAAFTALNEAGTKLQTCKGIWHLKGQAEVLNRKYHAGATAVVSRAPASVGRRSPPYVASNIDPIMIALSKITLYCFPDRILVYRDNHVGAVAYDSLTCESTDSRFIEEGTPPRDAKVIGHTWRYVNKDCGPDRRFNNNPQRAICQYNEVTLKSGSGLREILQLSRAAIGLDFATSVARLAAAGMGAPPGRGNLVFRTAGWGPETVPATTVDGQTTVIGRAIPAAIVVSLALAGGISVYCHNAASEPDNSAPPTLSAQNSPPPAPPQPTSRRRHRRPAAVKVARTGQVAGTGSAPAAASSRPLSNEAMDLGRSAPASTGPTTFDDLTTVRARDSHAAERIATYCTSVAATSTDPAASESACRRNEAAAWTRIVVDKEFPKLDAATLAKCGQPPFPASYQGLEACARYELHAND